MIVKEIFGPTIQGEGSFAGSPVSFLRLSGCNRWSGLEKDRAKSFCNFCDTDFRGGKKMSNREIFNALDLLGQRRIVISGGEPMLQLKEEHVKYLTGYMLKLHIETNGSKKMGAMLPYFEHITCSPKQVFEETELEFAHDLKILFPYKNCVTLDNFKDFKRNNTYLQPIMDENYDDNLAKCIRECCLTGTKLSVQLHKILRVQ